MFLYFIPILFKFCRAEISGKASSCHDIICHGSDAVSEADREINIWFKESELTEFINGA
jgi:hypothetical protein